MTSPADNSLESSVPAVALRGVVKVGAVINDHRNVAGADAQRRLFEPFYTTKPAGEGLGLGLAISLTIVESYGGALNAHNMADGGAEFVLSLPRASDA